MKLGIQTIIALVIASSAAIGCSSSTTNSSGEGGRGGDGAGGVGGGTAACTLTDGCADDEYCDFPDDQCGAGTAGLCEKRPNFCGDGALIVCSCDSKVEYAGCQTLSGFDRNANANACNASGSALGEDVFTCGDRFCRAGVSYCQHSVSDIDSVPDSYSCEFLPSACGDGNTDPTCACLDAEPCGSGCDDGGAGAITLTCPGG
jgi:hypothetical protein